MKPIDEVKKCIEDAIGSKSIGVIYLDIDNMQAHNDCFGYFIGDETITKIAECIYESTQTIACHCFRIAGDEFIIIFSGRNALSTFQVADDIKK